LSAFEIIAFAAGYGPAAIPSPSSAKSESGGSKVKQELDMETSPNYLSVADIGSQQFARLMRDVRSQALAGDTNRFERSAQ
jgi:hypothetical protein